MSNLKRSTYYYTVNKQDKDMKNDDVMNKIIEIYYKHDGRYGYRRITLELDNQGFHANHKKVKRLMSRMGLYSIVRKKRKYSSYKGTVGKVADNLINREFEAEKPNKKWFTDVTEFNLRGEKLYLSPILDSYGRYIVSYNVSKSPNLAQINDMLTKAFNAYKDLTGLIFHSDQGWQYQHQSYQTKLKERGILQSMSRKGNSMDNGLMENFFGIMKSEMFYDQEHKYKNSDDLIEAIHEYMYYYNHDRIKAKLNGKTPVEYRNLSFIQNTNNDLIYSSFPS